MAGQASTLGVRRGGARGLIHIPRWYPCSSQYLKGELYSVQQKCHQVVVVVVFFSLFLFAIRYHFKVLEYINSFTLSQSSFCLDFAYFYAY